MPTQEDIATIIDIGSAETKVLLANPFSTRVIGFACGKTEGMKKGEIVDLPKLNASVHEVIQKAEAISGDGGVHGSYACLTISSVAVLGEQISGYTSVKDPSHKVGENDMRAAREDAYSNPAPQGYALVHRIRQEYSLDDQKCENPEGKICNTSLSYSMWRICAKRDYLGNLLQIPNGLSLEVKRLFLASLASDAALSDSDSYDKKNRLVIDIGAGTTDYIFYQNGVVCATGVIPVGGEHITNDISVKLQTSPKTAERLKISHACACVHPSAAHETIKPLDNDALASDTYSQYVIDYVVNLRVLELFSLVKDELPRPAMIDVVKLTGGTSLLKEIGNAAAQIFGTDVVQDAPNCVFPDMPGNFAAECRDPKYSTVLGAFLLLSKELRRSSTQRKDGSLSGLIKIFSRKNRFH